MHPRASAPREAPKGRRRRASIALLAALLAPPARAAAPAPALDPQPSSAPGVRWTFPESHLRELAGPRAAVIDHDPGQGRRALALHDLVTGRVIRELSDLWDPRAAPPDVLATPEALLLLRGGQELVALHPGTGAVLSRFNLSVGTGDRPRPLAVVRAAGPRDLVVLSEGFDIRALDLLTGAERWRTPRSDTVIVPWSTIVAGDLTFLARTDDWRVAAVDAATGRSQWIYPEPPRRDPVQAFALDADRAAYSTADGAVRIVDAATGAERAALAIARTWNRLVRLALRGDTVFVEHAYRLEAWDVPTRALRWAIDLGAGELELGRHAAYVCAPSGELTAHDLATGAALWELGLGACRLRWPRDAVIVEDHAGDSVVTSRRDVVSYALPPAPPVPVLVSGRAWLDGQVLRDTPIRVGRQTVTTDARGRFRARVTASGRVRVQVDPGLGRTGAVPCLRGVAEEIEVTPGKSRHSVTLRERTAPRAACEGE